MTGFSGQQGGPRVGGMLGFLCMALTHCASAQEPALDISAQLSERNYAALEASLSSVQSRFENGELTELELRDAFKPFGTAKGASGERLREWVATSPDSYVAHLALGVYYRQHGSTARGRKYIEKTPQENIDRMMSDFGLAEGELRKSLSLTRKPYLSLFNLMAIAGNVSRRTQLDALLLLANEAAPDNAEVRLRYGLFLLPRWGGSYESFEAFMGLNRRQGVSESTIQQLQAIEHNDRGMVLSEKGDPAGAKTEFELALQGARQSGGNGRFARDHLVASMRHLCRDAQLSDFCPAAEGDPVAPVRPAHAAESAAYAGRIGDDLAHSVVVEASDEVAGIRIEYAWIGLRYPGYQRRSQALIAQSGRWFDVINITAPDGHQTAAYFDITSFYRKLAGQAAASKG